jgi:hypothetical protein
MKRIATVVLAVIASMVSVAAISGPAVSTQARVDTSWDRPPR